MRHKKEIIARYRSMMSRCYTKSHAYFADYGGRGISVCKEWRKKPNEFYKWAIRNGYKKKLQIDRIDNNGDYSPENCRWVTPKVNSNNTRKNLMITYSGKTQSLTMWCEELDLHYPTIHARINKYDWDCVKALTKPVRKLKSA